MPGCRRHGNRGAAYVYRFAGGSWVLDATLAPAERGPFARFGGAVAMLLNRDHQAKRSLEFSGDR